MDNQSTKTWKNSNVFLISMIGAVLGLTSLTQFSFLVYENGGGAFFIPYIIATVIIGIPFLILEFGAGVKFKSSLSKLLFNIKHEFEYLGWFTIFVVFLILAIYICVMGWDLVYVILSLFKGWGHNPGIFFNNTLLHSGSNLYSLTYLIVPIAIAILSIWILIYFISKKGIKKGVARINLIFVPIIIGLFVAIFLFVLPLNGAKLGMALIISPNWSSILNYHVWIAAFTQVLFVLLVGQGVASSFTSYFDDDYEGKLRLVDNAWIIALVSFIFQILFSLIVFGLLGALLTENSSAINSIQITGFNLIFVIIPMVFNTMGVFGNVVAFLVYFLLFLLGLTSAVAIIEPFVSSIVEKFNFSRSRALRYICIIGIFTSLVFATGMGYYLISVVLEFLMKFAILLAVLLELVVIAWVYGADRLVETINEGTSIKVDTFWIFFIKYISPIILIVLIIFGLYELILYGDSRTLFIDSIIAVIFVLAPLVLTLNLVNNDLFDLDLDLDLHTLGSNKFKSSNENAEFSSDGSFINPYKYKKDKRNGKNVISNVDLSSSAFDSPRESTLDDFNEEGGEEATRGKSVFGKINMFNKAKENYEDSFANLDSDDLGSEELNSKDMSSNNDFNEALIDSDLGGDYEDINSNQHNFEEYLDEFDDFENISESNYYKSKNDEYDTSEYGYSDLDNLSDGEFIEERTSKKPFLSLSKLKSLFSKKSKDSNLVDYDSNSYDYAGHNSSNYGSYDGGYDESKDSDLVDYDSNYDYNNYDSDDSVDYDYKESKDDDYDEFVNQNYYDLNDGYDESNDSHNSKNYGYDSNTQPNNSKFRKSFDFDFDDDLDMNKKESSQYDKSFKDSSNKTKNNQTKIKDKQTKLKNSKNKVKSKPDIDVEEYQDFTNDFFDDGVFGDGGYESLLDDYVEPVNGPKSLSKSKQSSPSLRKGARGYDYESVIDLNDKSEEGEDEIYSDILSDIEEDDYGEGINHKSKPKVKTKVNKSKNRPKTITISADRFDETKVYDFESKGSDSVFNLDD